jgi:hypothetical protein
MAGAIIGVLFIGCCFALTRLPHVAAHERKEGAVAAVKGVTRDLASMVKTRAGRLSALLCFLPVGTGAAQVVLAQAAVAARWGAGAAEVEKVQGLASGAVTAAGCFVGGWICQRVHPRLAYAGIGLGLGVIAIGMAMSPATVAMYVTWSFTYAFGVGLSYAAFTAFVLDAMGVGSAATKYNIFASLSNFPIWWVGLLLGRVADLKGAPMMLYTEAALAVVAIVIFATATRVAKPTAAAAVPVPAAPPPGA